MARRHRELPRRGGDGHRHHPHDNRRHLSTTRGPHRRRSSNNTRGPHRRRLRGARPSNPTGVCSSVRSVAVVAVAVIGAGLWAWSRADTNSTRLDVHQAESGVAQILSDPINGYGANRVVAVACNNGRNPVVRAGATFTCAVEINDTLRRVIVEFTDDNGTYAVDGPR
ncbi:DUF4333 domain-containing protein [Mycolicibacterium peregrinum]